MKFEQTIARIGAGLASMLMLVWLLWPGSISEILQLEPEPLAMFLIAFATWIMTEFKMAETEMDRVECPQLSVNDLRVARELIALQRGRFRDFLRDHEAFQYIDYETVSEIHALLARRGRDELKFQNPSLDLGLARFLSSLEILGVFYAQHTGPEQIGGRLMVAFKPSRIVTDEEYARRLQLSHEADKLSEGAWSALDKLVRSIEVDFPSVLDAPL